MEFSFDTVHNFDEHIRKSVPDYGLLFESLVHLSDYFVIDGKKVYDLGCSTGKLLHCLHERHPNIKMVGIDRSRHLLPESDVIDFVCADLNEWYDFRQASLVYSIFTLQFLNKDARRSLVQDIFAGLCEGGALIVAEKVYSEDGMLQDIFTSSYYQYKEKAFSASEILEKERSLRKILHPLTSHENITMLKDAGFKRVIPFYKHFNFEAHLCIT